jgi:hypothetical protein
MVSEETKALNTCGSAIITGAIERRINATLFGCGTSPFIVLNSTPSIEKAKSNINQRQKRVHHLLYQWNILFYCETK